jgi:hypothetical protein
MGVSLRRPSVHRSARRIDTRRRACFAAGVMASIRQSHGGRNKRIAAFWRAAWGNPIGGERIHAHWVSADGASTAHLDLWGIRAGTELMLPKPE